jgi:hypothetical protein
MNDYGDDPATERAAIHAGVPRSLYECNVFGPELVERLERERVLSAPAWRVTPLGDGGVMVIPNACFGYSCNRTDDHRSAVAEHLGLPWSLWGPTQR